MTELPVEELAGFKLTEHSSWHNQPANMVYRVKSYYVGMCHNCGRTHFTDRIRSPEALQQLKDLGWAPYQEGDGTWYLRCPDCHDIVDYDPAPEETTFELTKKMVG